jgi:hypothetical protein
MCQPLPNWPDLTSVVDLDGGSLVGQTQYLNARLTWPYESTLRPDKHGPLIGERHLVWDLIPRQHRSSGRLSSLSSQNHTC